MSLKLTMTEYNLHEEGEWLPGEIKAIEETPGGLYGPGLKWLILLDGDESDTWAFTGQALTPKARLTRWVQALDPANPPEIGQVVDLEDYVGKRVDVFFEQEKQDGITKEKVTKIRAEKKASTLAKGQKAAAQAKSVAEQARGVLKDDESPF